MSRLIETVRYAEGRVQNFDYHLRRMQDSSQAIFGDTLRWNPKDLVWRIELPGNDVYKIRIVYGYTEGSATTEPYTIRPVRSLKLVLDNNIMYDHKFENRSRLEELVAQRGDCDDILIVKNGLVTDVSYANIVFRKDGKWFTPDSFLLNGTMRQWLLDTGKISERTITVDDIRQYSHFKLINAMLCEDAPASEVLNIR